MFDSLSLEERNDLLSLVTSEQKEFLENHVKCGRATLFAQFMTLEKVQAIRKTDEIDLTDEEKDVVGWKIVHYHDYGCLDGKCACNRPIRYEFTVQHTITKKSIIYSKFHLAEFLSLKVSDIDEVMDHVWNIDYELDELLVKIRDKDYGYEILDILTGKIKIPKNIQEHVERQIPLLNRQLKLLGREVSRVKEEEAREHHGDAKKVEKEQMERFAAQEQLRREQREAYQKAQGLLREKFELKQQERQKREQKLLEDVQTEFSIHATIGEIAYTLVKHGVSSATKISHMIRDNYDVNKEFSKGIYGRPSIYPEVVRALINYSEQGKLSFDQESSSIKDCIFTFDVEEQLAEQSIFEVQTTLF